MRSESLDLLVALMNGCGGPTEQHCLSCLYASVNTHIHMIACFVP